MRKLCEYLAQELSAHQVQDQTAYFLVFYLIFLSHFWSAVKSLSCSSDNDILLLMLSLSSGSVLGRNIMFYLFTVTKNLSCICKLTFIWRRLLFCWPSPVMLTQIIHLIGCIQVQWENNESKLVLLAQCQGVIVQTYISLVSLVLPVTTPHRDVSTSLQKAKKSNHLRFAKTFFRGEKEKNKLKF